MTTDESYHQPASPQTGEISVSPQPTPSNSTDTSSDGLSSRKVKNDEVKVIHLKLYSDKNTYGQRDEGAGIELSGATFPPAKVDEEYNAVVEFDVHSKSNPFPTREITLKNQEEQDGFKLVLDDKWQGVKEQAKNFGDYGLNVEITLKGKPKEKETNKLKVRVYGKPNVEFNGGFRFSITSKGYQRISNPISFIINPDPWSLWKDLPHDGTAPYNDKPDTASKTARVGDFLVLAASLRGRSHAHVGAFRDDEFLIKLAESPDQWSVLAVADGAGSARYSREGSKLACQAAVKSWFQYLNDESCRQRLEAELLSPLEERLQDANAQCESPYDFSELAQDFEARNKLFYTAPYYGYDAIKEEHENRKNEEERVTIKDYNTTLLLTAFRRLTLDDTSYTLFLSYWIGDGAPAVFKPNGCDKVFLLGKVDAGEYAGQTRFLTNDQIKPELVCARLRFLCVKDFEALAMMTDGVSDPFFNSENDLSQFDDWNVFWKDVLPQYFPGVLNQNLTDADRAEKLLDGLNFKKTSYHDDRTLLLLLPHQGETPLVDVEESTNGQVDGESNDAPSLNEASQESAESAEESVESPLTPPEYSPLEKNAVCEENSSSEDNAATNSNS